MSVYPRNLSNFLNRMSGYNKNSVKMNVLGSSEANNGDVVQVDLPTNSIVDLSSLAWSFDVEYFDRFEPKNAFRTKQIRDFAWTVPQTDGEVWQGPKIGANSIARRSNLLKLGRFEPCNFALWRNG